MTAISPPKLAWLFRQPDACRAYACTDWDIVIRQARTANVLARLAFVIDRAELMAEVPTAPRRHLQSGLIMARQQRISALFEIDAIRKAVARTGTKMVLLKGGAYVARGLDAAEGRLFADIDILVPRERLADVESALMLHGWNTIDHDEYDQRYYRQWMHEIPPLRHMLRGTTIDVHHTILPPTAGRRLDANKLFAGAIELRDRSDVRVLSQTDMVLHSMTHLFYDGELEHGFRDLVDLDSLLRQFATSTPDFWRRLNPRAQELDLVRPLYYGLRFVRFVMGTPIPESVMSESEHKGPHSALRGLSDAIFLRALNPAHPTCSDSITPVARWLLYVRSHWLRMPPHLLAVHLARKALIPAREVPEPEPDKKR